MTKIVFFGDPDVKTDGDIIYTAGLKEQNVDLFVNLGDNGYSGANPIKLLEKHFPKNSEQYKKLVLVLGNHDDGESESDSTEEKCGAFLPEQYKSKPEFDNTDQSWQNTRWLTSRHVGDIYFIGMNSQDMDIEFKRNQYNWVIKEIESAKKLRSEGKIKWIIGGVHKPWFTLKSSHSPYTAVREIYSKVFEDVVNQMWHGHNHNDQAWWSMIAINQSGNAAGEQKQSFLSDGKTIDHSKPHGWTTNINGHSGHEHNKFKENATANKNVQWANDKTFSYSVVESNGNLLNTKWKDKSGNILYEYNISLEGDVPTGKAPIANFTYSPLTVKDNDTVSLDATSSSDSDGTIVSYKWILSDQLVVDKPNEAKATFNIGTKANVDVTLTVTDNNGLTGTKTLTIEKTTTPPVGCPSGQCKDPSTQQCRPIGANETVDANGFCKTIPPVGCPTGQCKDPNTLQCRFPTADETIENGFCKKIIVPPPAGKLTPISVAASGQDLGKEASKAIDGDLESRWSCNGDGAWIEFKFDKVYPITKVKLTCYHYDKTYFFEINGKRFENLAGRPINSLVEYDLTDLKIVSDTIRIIGHGNNLTTYNSIREIEFYTGTTDPRHCPPNWHYDETLKKCIPDLEPSVKPGSNKSPIANAGQDQTVAPKSTVTLNGLASSDPDGTITAYSWSQLSGPTVSITNANSAVATFVAPEIGTNPNSPIAQFTYSPTSPKDNEIVTLNSTASTGTNITRKWSITDQLVISNPTGTITTFNIGTKRTVDVTLLVTDSNGLTATKTVTINNSSIPSTELDAEAEALILAKVGETVLLKDNGSKGAITRHEWLKETPDAQAIQLIADSSAKFGAKFIATSNMIDKDIKFKLRVFDAQNNFNDDITGTKVSITAGNPSGGFGQDAFGMKMLFKPTGKKVAMEKGSDHENGQRYNVNHEFHNYIMQGYFKLGKGQEKINHKGDGPNHGGCSDKKICAWYELDYTLATGKGELQLENPHPTNIDVPDSSCEFVKTLAKAKEGQWMGWATAYFWGSDGKRHIRAYVDLNPFADIMTGEGKPLNNWQELVFAIEKGQIFKGITHPRDMQAVIDHEAGLESEIRMHRAVNHDTAMKNVFVFEIDPKASAIKPFMAETINWQVIPDSGSQERRNANSDGLDDQPPKKSQSVIAAALPTDLIFQLRVTDNKGASSTDTVKITVTDSGNPPVNQPPIANAGQDQIVASEANVTLNGSSSTDPDGTIQSYKWIQISGKPVTLNNSNSAIATFKAPNLFATEPPKNYRYTFSHKWGSNGTGNGQFRQLEGMAVDKDNNIYVGDWVRQDIQKFKPDGTFIRRFGGVVGQASSKNGEFNTPFSIRFDPEDGHMWVADQFNHRLQKINRDTGAYMGQIGPTIAGANPPNLNEPEDVDFDPSDYSMYINDQHNSRIVKVDRTGKFITQWQPFDETYPDEYPEGISVNPTTRNLYVTAYFTPKVSVFNPQGKLEFDITLPEGTGAGQFTLPLERNYFHKDGTFYQLNGNSKPKVYVFNTPGTLLTEFGTGPGSGNGQLDDAEQLAVDSNHNVYIADQNNYRISVFRADPVTIHKQDHLNQNLTFQLTVTDNKGAQSNDMISVTVAENPDLDHVHAAFPELLAKAKPGNVFVLDGSGSTGNITSWSIKQDEGPTVQLVDNPKKCSKQFIMPSEKVKFTLTVNSPTASDSDSITVNPDNDTTIPTGKVLWDSNIHLKTGQKYTITDTYKEQTPDSKGIFMAASGNPKLEVEADGTFYLVANAGHGRAYIRARNYNAMYELEMMFPDDFNVVRNGTIRLRSRHNEGGSNENKFGGFGATIEVQEQLAEYSTEPYHNLHENDIKKPLAKKIERGKWFKVRYQVCNSPDNKKVLFRTQYDYMDGNGWVEVLKGEHPSPKPYYMDKALYDKESYAWLRINNEGTGRIAYRNVKIIEINSIQ